MRKIISIIVTLSFLLSNLSFAGDTYYINEPKGNINLATPLILDDIGMDSPSSTHKCFAIAELGLQMELKTAFGRNPAIMGTTDLNVVREALMKLSRYEKGAPRNKVIITYENAIEQIADTSIFLIPISVDYGSGRTDYRLLFSTVIDTKTSMFPVSVVSKEKLAEIRDQIVRRKAVPQYQSDIRKSIDNFIWHERYDYLLEEIHRLGLTYPIDIRGDIDSVETVSGLRFIDKEGLTPIRKRECFIIPSDTRIKLEIDGETIEGTVEEIINDDRFKVPVRDKNGKLHFVPAYGHASNESFHFIVPRNLFEALKARQNGTSITTAYEEDLCLRLAHELGKVTGQDVTIDNGRPVNRVDSHYANKIGALPIRHPQVRRPPQLHVVDLDVNKNLYWRDYAGGELKAVSGQIIRVFDYARTLLEQPFILDDFRAAFARLMRDERESISLTNEEISANLEMLAELGILDKNGAYYSATDISRAVLKELINIIQGETEMEIPASFTVAGLRELVRDAKDAKRLGLGRGLPSHPRDSGTEERDMKGAKAPAETNPIIQQLIEKGKIVEVWLEGGQLNAHKVKYVNGYQPGVTHRDEYLDQNEPGSDIRTILSEDEIRNLAEWIRTHHIRGAPVRFRIVLGQIALGWKSDADHSNISHAGKGDGVIYTGEYLLKFIMREDKKDKKRKQEVRYQELRKEILDNDEWQHLQGKGHGMPEAFDRRLKYVESACLEIANSLGLQNKATHLKRIANIVRRSICQMLFKTLSGHPGGSLSCAEILTTLYFGGVLNYDPNDHKWENRDRVILSAGHKAPALYAVLAEAGFFSKDEFKHLREHPEAMLQGHVDMHTTPGVDLSTGALGQGFSSAVGMAAAARLLKRPSHFWTILGGGEEQEGQVSEAARHAASLGLTNQTVIIDDNGYQIEGEGRKVDRADLAKVWEGYGWNVVTVDGHDPMQLLEAMQKAKDSAGKADKPTCIIAKTKKGKGVSIFESEPTKSHGEVPKDKAKHEQALREINEAIGEYSEDILEMFKGLAQLIDYEKAFIDDEYNVQKAAFQPIEKTLSEVKPGDKEATRSSFGEMWVYLGSRDGRLVAMSADLGPSNKMDNFEKVFGRMSAERPDGRYVALGIREAHGASFAQGMALMGLVPAIGTFDIFMLNMAPQIRVAAQNGIPVIFIATHSGVGVGEDAKSHQGVESPGVMDMLSGPLGDKMDIYEPADKEETRIVLLEAVKAKRPVYIRLTRQDLPILDKSHIKDYEARVREGSYILRDPGNGKNDLIIVATGGTTANALEASRELENKGIKAKVINVVSINKIDNKGNAFQTYLEDGVPIITVCDAVDKVLLNPVLRAANMARNRGIAPGIVYPRGVTILGSAPWQKMYELNGIEAKGIERFALETLEKERIRQRALEAAQSALPRGESQEDRGRDDATEAFDQLIERLRDANGETRASAIARFKARHPRLSRDIDAYLASLPISGKKILQEAKRLGRPVIACNIDNGELSTLQIRAMMQAALEMNAYIMFEVGPDALKTYAEGKPHLPEYCAREAHRLYLETGKVVTYAVHLDHNQIKASDYYKGTNEDKRNALQAAIDRAKFALAAGFTSFATDTSTLTELEKPDVRDRLSNVIETGAQILEVIYEGARQLGIEVGYEGEVGDIGKEISTVEEAIAYYKGLVERLSGLADRIGIDLSREPLIDVIALNIGTSHGYDFDENDRLIPYKPGRINIQRARKVHEAFKSMGLDIGIALHGFSGTPIEFAKDFVNTGIAKVNVNTDWQAIVWKVLEAYRPELYREIFNLARESAQKKDGVKKGLVTDDADYDYAHAKNRIIFGYARQLFRDKKNHPLLARVVQTLQSETRCLPVSREQKQEDHLNMRLTFDESAPGVRAIDAIKDLTWRRVIDLMTALSLYGSAHGIRIDRERELRLQDWQIDDLNEARPNFATDDDATPRGESQENREPLLNAVGEKVETRPFPVSVRPVEINSAELDLSRQLQEIFRYITERIEGSPPLEASHKRLSRVGTLKKCLKVLLEKLKALPRSRFKEIEKQKAWQEIFNILEKLDKYPSEKKLVSDIWKALSEIRALLLSKVESDREQLSKKYDARYPLTSAAIESIKGFSDYFKGLLIKMAEEALFSIPSLRIDDVPTCIVLEMSNMNMRWGRIPSEAMARYKGRNITFNQEILRGFLKALEEAKSIEEREALTRDFILKMTRIAVHETAGFMTGITREDDINGEAAEFIAEICAYVLLRERFEKYGWYNERIAAKLNRAIGVTVPQLYWLRGLYGHLKGERGDYLRRAIEGISDESSEEGAFLRKALERRFSQIDTFKGKKMDYKRVGFLAKAIGLVDIAFDKKQASSEFVREMEEAVSAIAEGNAALSASPRRVPLSDTPLRPANAGRFGRPEEPQGESQESADRDKAIRDAIQTAVFIFERICAATPLALRGSIEVEVIDDIYGLKPQEPTVYRDSVQLLDDTGKNFAFITNFGQFRGRQHEDFIVFAFNDWNKVKDIVEQFDVVNVGRTAIEGVSITACRLDIAKYNKFVLGRAIDEPAQPRGESQESRGTILDTNALKLLQESLELLRTAGYLSAVTNYAQVVENITWQITGKLRRDEKERVLIFSETATFGNFDEKKGPVNEFGLGRLLAQLVKNGIKVIVIAKDERKKALIEEVNKQELEDTGKELKCADNIAEATTIFKASGYDYYYTDADEPEAFNGITTYNITGIVQKIIAALSKAFNITESLTVLERACKMFAQAA